MDPATIDFPAEVIAAIVDAVAARLTADHGAGSWTGSGGSSLTAADIDTVLTASHGSGSWVGSPATGTGILSTRITVKDDNGNLLDGVSCWVTTDRSGHYVVEGPRYTDTFGSVSFMLQSGNYYLWQQRSGVNFDNPLLIDVQP